MARVLVNEVEYTPAGGVWHSVDPETDSGGPPDDDRQVMVFLNGHVRLRDVNARRGGGWGIRLGFFDYDKRRWRAGGRLDDFVTHWRDLPDPPAREIEREDPTKIGDE